ncbi:MAG: TldD/PmbA family protein [Bacteriovoracaceae bacterium]|jgi:PmbA protein|nr:TldD/PmbA family protein [Bacteriovoracaceae bacterium]
MNQDLIKTIEKVIDLAKAKGADCDVTLSKGESISLSAQNESIDKYSISGSQIIGVRTIKDNKIGVSYSESFDDESLSLMVKNAVETSAFSDENEFEQISATKDENHNHPCEVQRDNSSMEQKIALALELEKKVKQKDSRVVAVPYNGLSEGASESYYMNSNGAFGFSSESSLSCYTSALISNGKENSMNYHSSISRNLAGLNIDECINESIDHAANWLDAAPVKTGNYDIVFDINALDSVFGCFGSIYSAKSAWEKVNPFEGKIGTQVAHQGLTITDIPNYGDAFYKYHYDSEGFQRSNLTLVENGVLKSFYHNSSTAKYFKAQNTNHASRGAKSGLGVSGTNMIIIAGKETSPLSGEYLEICSLQGLHSGASVISGDFSFGASGYLCKDGKRLKGIKGITVSGNFYEMIKKIRCIGDTLQSNVSKDFFSPILRFENMSVAGN